jgi:hypothetical protein
MMEKNGEIRLGVTPLEDVAARGEHVKESEDNLEEHVTKRLADKASETLSASKDE